MRSSGDRVLTTHVGSLPRGEPLSSLLLAKDAGETVDQSLLDATVSQTVLEVVRRQVDVGIDVVSDGELSKISYATYVKDRLTGFDGNVARRPALDLADHAGFAKRMAAFVGEQKFRREACVGPIEYAGHAALAADLANLEAAVAQSPEVTAAFMNAASPGLVSAFQENSYYPSHEAYVEAIGAAMQVEYEAIVQAGFLLQLDCPDLAMARHTGFQELSDEQFVARAAHAVEVLNFAVRNIPPERMRMHVCWGNYEGPHDHDIDLRKILPSVLRARPSAILFEASNPRHAHEWTVWRDCVLPDDKVLIPGVIASTSNYVEHPELVAQRIELFAGMVGRERVLAGSDCGFATFAGIGKVDPDIAFKKLAALAEGARLASQRLARSSTTGPAVVGDVEVLEIDRECERLVIESARLNDDGQWAALADLYTPDGMVRRPSGQQLVGREAIIASYSSRPAERTTRHVCSGWRCRVESDSVAYGTTTVTVYTSETSSEPMPIERIAVGEFEDRFVRTLDGWRIVSRTTSITMQQ